MRSSCAETMLGGCANASPAKTCRRTRVREGRGTRQSTVLHGTRTRAGKQQQQQAARDRRTSWPAGARLRSKICCEKRSVPFARTKWIFPATSPTTRHSFPGAQHATSGPAPRLIDTASPPAARPTRTPRASGRRRASRRRPPRTGDWHYVHERGRHHDERLRLTLADGRRDKDARTAGVAHARERAEGVRSVRAVVRESACACARTHTPLPFTNRSARGANHNGAPSPSLKGAAASTKSTTDRAITDRTFKLWRETGSGLTAPSARRVQRGLGEALCLASAMSPAASGS